MKKVTKTAQEWRAQLSPQAFNVCRKHGTEAPFSGEFYDYKGDGVYHCVCCNEPLFTSDSKFDSGTGWPSYYETINETAITEISDSAFGMVRTEVLCSTCDAHLGHVFNDGPRESGKRFCSNGLCLIFKPE